MMNKKTEKKINSARKRKKKEGNKSRKMKKNSLITTKM